MEQKPGGASCAPAPRKERVTALANVCAVKMENITKRFGKVTANKDVTLELYKGEILSLLGENGSGKTTLMNMLAGIYFPDEGEILVGGNPVTIASPKDAFECGIGMIHQHFKLVDIFTATENIVLGLEEAGKLDLKAAAARITEICQKYGFVIDPNKKVYNMSVSEKQTVEIVKVLYRGADILILDEPTAVLTPIEVQEFFSALRQLRAEGKSIIIITHKLYEVMEIADRCTVLRDGQLIGSVDKDKTSMQQLASMMVGREYSFEGRHPSQAIGETFFSVEHLSYRKNGIPILQDIALSLHRGEILGVAGIDGNGQTELIEALTGLLRPDSMELTLNGKKIQGTAADFIAAGIGHVPEDRTVRGLSLARSIEENSILGYENQAQFSRRGIMDYRYIRKNAEALAQNFRIKAPNVATPCGALSGGNQQKVVIARVFSQSPEVVICAQPTRGVDVSASEYIHEVMLAYRDQGKGILLISADLDEVKKLSDTIAVIYQGRIVAVDRAEHFDDNRLGLLMTGAAQDPGKEA